MGELACKHLKFMEMAKEHESTVSVLEFIPSMENTAIQNTGKLLYIWCYYS